MILVYANEHTNTTGCITFVVFSTPLKKQQVMQEPFPCVNLFF